MNDEAFHGALSLSTTLTVSMASGLAELVSTAASMHMDEIGHDEIQGQLFTLLS